MQAESKNVAPDEGVKRPVCSRRLSLTSWCQLAGGYEGSSLVYRFFRCQSSTRRNNMEQLIGNVRTMFLVRSDAAILFGILTLVWPNLTLSVLVLLFGVFAVASGITAMAAALRNREEQGWGLLLFEGILGILAGVVALVWPNITALAFLYLLAAWAIITGILELVAPLSFPMSFGRGLLMALAGIFSIVFGILIAAQPAAGLLTVVWLIGIYAIVFGIMYIVVYFESRSVASSLA